MQTRGNLIDHAETAIERTARSLADMRARLGQSGTLGQQHRLLLDSAVQDLTRRHELLSTLYEAMVGAPADELPARWQKFFACYDDYLSALRDAKSRLVQGTGQNE
jgi:hypothetical protein